MSTPIESSVPDKSEYVGYVENTDRELVTFLRHMAQRESNNNHRVVNRFGMMGKYQFNPNTVKGLGFNVDRATFLSDSLLQDSVMVRYLRANNATLASIIFRYDGKIYKGVYISRSGILAAAHLAGAGGVKRYFSNPDDMHGRADANGTTLRNYLEEFNKYNLKESF